jgi:hypothetical protein
VGFTRFCGLRLVIAGGRPGEPARQDHHKATRADAKRASYELRPGATAAPVRKTVTKSGVAGKSRDFNEL